MEDANTGAFGDVLSEGREDIEFGTVSEILKVSSSLQSESASYAEAASVKIEASIDKTSCTNFELIKSKKIKRTSKRIEKPIISSNKFEILEHEDLQIEETSTANIKMGSESFQKSISEIQWKTVQKSKQDKREIKSLKYRLDPLKKFETRNPFRLLENISEEYVDSIMKRMKEIKFIKTLKKADIKQCHSCNFKKRSCMMDRSSCSAVNKKCFFCKKTGHFPKSLRCKKFRKTNLQLTSQQQFPNSEDKGKIESFDFEGKCQQKENEAVLMRKRCPKCFITHFPYPKFCQWAKSSERKKEILPDITNELKDIIEKHIERIERKEHRWEDLIIDAEFPNEDFVPQFPDLVLENNRKLRGGAKEETVKQFVSKTESYNTVLNLLRSSKLFEQFNNHIKCQVTDMCSFCLLRSSMFKINNPKGRRKIIPLEIEIQLRTTSDQRSITSILEEILDKASSSNQEFKNSICIKNCNVRDFYGISVKNDLKTYIFSCTSMEVDLQENITVGSHPWRCVGAVSSNGVTYFRVGNK